MPALSKKQLARRLAERLADGAWTEADVQVQLRRSLPDAWQRTATNLAKELLGAKPQSYAPNIGCIADLLTEQSGFGRLYALCYKQDVWPDPWLSISKMQPTPAFAALDIPQLATTADLADWLFISIDQLDSYADVTGWREDHDEMAVNHYFYHLSPKRQGGLRVIEAPKPRLKAIQRCILMSILSKVPVHPDSFAFTHGRDCRAAAARHAGEQVLMCFDLKDYFNSIPSARIYGLFRCLGYPTAVARVLTGFSTVRTPKRILACLPAVQRQVMQGAHLPQGAPSSPALANLVSYNLDRRLSGLARRLGASYSRYADDLSFSGDLSIRRPLQTLVPQIVDTEGFTLNPAKTRVMTSKQRQVVTGLVVNERVNITRPEFDRLKAVIHRGSWRQDAVAHARLLGQIGWVAQVNPAKGEKLHRLMDQGVGAGLPFASC